MKFANEVVVVGVSIVWTADVNNVNRAWIHECQSLFVVRG